ncbi:hypothetical protein FQN54_006996 [Arachnomyces sp. PD_36]|nr:hypothetical protein FQN54_006996 [Arachnomyces sp. PD_36]
MAGTEANRKENLHGIVDMGSNGIRFSVSDLSPPTTRNMPTVYQHREGISLYDAQINSEDGSRIPIPEDVIKEVSAALRRFKATCEDFEVPPKNIHVLATEATRTAPNGEDFRQAIKEATGWDTKLLSKEEEGRIGALGVASSFASVEGLVMDLGGGSTQITWMVAKDGVVNTSPKGSMSFPYGAAALLRRLEDARAQSLDAETELKKEIKSRFQQAYRDLEIPDDLRQVAEKEGGFDLYLCGGGFRGWGYVLMSQSNIDPYPVPIINGFKASKEDFKDTISVQKVVLDSQRSKDKKIFGVSKRRASQVPAVAFLVSALSEAIPDIKDIQFCQGGVREGFLFDTIAPEIKSQDPLVVATSPFATKSADGIAKLLIQALPVPPQSQILPAEASTYPPPSFTPNLLFSLSNLMFAHSPNTKESRSAAALHSTTTGLLSSAHGLSHTDRALLALMLCERWSSGSDLAPSEKPLRLRLEQSVSMREAWWCRYVGHVAGLVGDMYPAGVIRETRVPRIAFQARRLSGRGKKGLSEVVELSICIPRDFAELDIDMVTDAVISIEKVGKKKNWIKAEDRLGIERVRGDWGLKVEAKIEK